MYDTYLSKVIYVGIRENLRQRWAYAFASQLDGYVHLTDKIRCPRNDLARMIDRVAKRITKRRTSNPKILT